MKPGWRIGGKIDLAACGGDGQAVAYLIDRHRGGGFGAADRLGLRGKTDPRRLGPATIAFSRCFIKPACVICCGAATNCSRPSTPVLV